MSIVQPVLGWNFDFASAWGIASWNCCKSGTVFEAPGKFSEPVNTSSQGQTFNWAIAGALEVCNIAQAGDYPSNGSISFYGLGLYDYRFDKIASPAWSVTNLSSRLIPQGGYGGSLPQQVSLTY